MPRIPAGRLAFGVFDQILVSLSNFLVLVLVARTVTAEAFGAFALAMEVYLVAICISRGLATDPLTSAHAADDAEGQRRATQAGGSAALMASVLMAMLTAAVGLVTPPGVGNHLFLLAVLLPGLVLQDFQRFALIVRRDAGQAFLNDLLYLVIQVPLLLAVIATGGGSVMLLLGWGVAGLIAALVGITQIGYLPASPRHGLQWLREHVSLWPYFLLDNLFIRLSSLMLFVVLAAAAGLAEVAGLRAAVTIFAPLAILGRGVVSIATPELARRRDQPRWVSRTALWLSGILVPMPLLWGIVFVLLPESVGRTLLGDSWSQAQPLLIFAAFFNASSMFATAITIGLRALGAAREGLTVRMTVTAGASGLATVGALVDGAHGAAVVLALTAPLQAIAWWRVLVRATRKRDLQPEVTPTDVRS